MKANNRVKRLLVIVTDSVSVFSPVLLCSLSASDGKTSTVFLPVRDKCLR